MAVEPRWVRSKYLTYHENQGAYFIYHNLYGFLMKMSHDVLTLIDAFQTPLSAQEALDRFSADLGGNDAVSQFLQILQGHFCLVPENGNEDENVWTTFPVINRWAVVHAPHDGPLTFYPADRDHKVVPQTLTDWQRQLWLACDGNQALAALLPRLQRNSESGQLQKVSAAELLQTIRRWVGLDLQYLRLSLEPISVYRHQSHRMPMYLRSVMPYKALSGLPPKPAEDPLEERREVSPQQYYSTDINDSQSQFELVETTLSHLLRDPHPVLGGLSYGQKFAAVCQQRGLLGPQTHDIAELGGGLGHLGRDFLAHIKAAWPESFIRTDYTIVDLSPVLQTAQRQAMREFSGQVRFLTGNAEVFDLGTACYDLIISNEMIGDLTSVRLGRAELGPAAGQSDEDNAAGQPGQQPDPASEQWWKKLGATGELIRKYDLPLHEAPDPFYLNVGAIRLLERIYKALRPGGAAVLTEYGDEMRYPVLNAMLDHPEFSIHFGMLRYVAEKLGFSAQFEFVIDLLEFDRKAMTLGATRSSFEGLQRLFQDHGLRLEKRAYTPEQLKALVGDKLRLDEVFPLPFEPVENRCMGLIPFQFKALLLQKPNV